MGGHHLILGRLTDFVSGETIDDTLDERHRQKIARLLVTQKSYLRSDIAVRRKLEITVDGKCAQLTVSFTIAVQYRTAMVIQYGPGSLVTRHRPALAMSRLIETYQIPVVVVTNGEQADILDGASGKPIGAGLEQIPDKKVLTSIHDQHNWETITPKRRQMESRILMAFEVDGRCPCDDSICTIK